MNLQFILVYLTVIIAVGYLVKKFILPKKLFKTRKSSTHGCGQEDCGCH